MKFLPFTEFAPAKVNLALHVLGRRTDGYHELDSIVAFADVGDTLDFEPAEAFAIAVAGPFAADLPPTDENIVTRAWDRLRAGLPDMPAVRIRLTKNLPVASGIGGGSANAAAAIRGAMRIAGLTAPTDELRAVALSLGADVPVCLVGKACRMRGVGEKLEVLETFAPRAGLLVNPGTPVATVDVFRALGLARNSVHGTAIPDASDPAHWRNDLAEPAIRAAPAIADVLAWLRSQPGAAYVNMSGSGATCFALGPSQHGTPPDGWWVRKVKIS